jgi:hypothetical protein
MHNQKLEGMHSLDQRRKDGERVSILDDPTR